VKGISLFAVPRLRHGGGHGSALVSNDVTIAGVIHKIGWRGLPSLALSFGDHGDCRCWLVGEPHRGLAYMFQMMNEARIMVGLNGASTASVAYHEALAYARMRPQGRPADAKGPETKHVPIIEHADVRRMLLRQKAIVEGSFALLAFTSLQADLAEHATTPEVRDRAKLLVDALTPIAKSFPAEWGFEANALAVQVHGGYGYSSEQLPEAWLREQKLNSIHEGTTGIHGMDLLGRRIVAGGGMALRVLLDHVEITAARAEVAGVKPEWVQSVRDAAGAMASVTATLAEKGVAGDVSGMLLHSTDYLALASITVVGWLWLWQATLAQEALGQHERETPFYEGKLHAAQYWITTELPRVSLLAKLCADGEDSYGRMRDAWF
jgi:butyryl-CoA dehydrogenase